MILAVQPGSEVPSVEQLAAVVAVLRAEVERLRVDNERLQAENSELRAENSELRRRLGSNSSKPPSSDGLARPRPKPGKGSGGRRRGKQPGSPGSTLSLVADPDMVVEHRPSRCAGPGCGADLSGGREYGRQRRQVVGLPERRLRVTEHQLIAVECAGCGQVTAAPGPAGVSGRAQYDTDVKAAAVYARAAQFLPYGRVAALISATWRTLQGLTDFATLRSYLSTASKHGMDALDVLQQLFTTGPWIPQTATSS